MPYGLYGKLVAQPGKRDEVANVLLRNVDELRSVGCQLYIVNYAVGEQDSIWVTEVWDSPDSHAASLQLASVKAAIAEAMPMLTGEFDQIKLDVVGGLGLG